MDYKLRAVIIGLALTLVLIALLLNVNNTIQEAEIRRVAEAKDSFLKEIGGSYRVVPENLRLDNKTHLIYIYYNPCSSCDPDRRQAIEESVKVWASNISKSEIQLDMINSYKSPNMTRPYLDSFKIQAQTWGFTTLIIYKNSEGLVLTPPFNNENLHKAVSRIHYGSISNSQSAKNIPLSTPIIYLLGAVSGINPCFIALASAFLAAATQDQIRKVARRLSLISLGLIYSYLIFFSLILSNPGVVAFLPKITWAVALVLLIIGILYLTEVIYDLYSRKWGEGSSIEAKIPMFRTPNFLKSRILASRSGGMFDFILGAFFSLVKLPCVAAYLFVLLVNSTNQLVDISIFTLGVISPIVLIGALISLGMVRINRLTELQFKGRLVQRTIIGVILILSVILLL